MSEKSRDHIACPHDVPPDPNPDERPPKPVAASGAGRRERGKLEGSGRAPDDVVLTERLYRKEQEMGWLS